MANEKLTVVGCFSLFLTVSHCFSLFLIVSRCFSLLVDHCVAWTSQFISFYLIQNVCVTPVGQ